MCHEIFNLYFFHGSNPDLAEIFDHNVKKFSLSEPLLFILQIFPLKINVFTSGFYLIVPLRATRDLQFFFFTSHSVFDSSVGIPPGSLTPLCHSHHWFFVRNLSI